MIKMKDLRQHIKKFHRKYKGSKYSFLGLVENQDLSPEVEKYFIGANPGWWDWVNGNEKMKALITKTVKGMEGKR